MGEMYNKFKFANNREDLLQYISPDNLPRQYGGEADWELEKYVQQRASTECCNVNL
eukprot:jgi/Bigna1/59670/fgenesh1_kg.6_\